MHTMDDLNKILNVISTIQQSENSEIDFKVLLKSKSSDNLIKFKEILNFLFYKEVLTTSFLDFLIKTTDLEIIEIFLLLLENITNNKVEVSGILD